MFKRTGLYRHWFQDEEGAGEPGEDGDDGVGGEGGGEGAEGRTSPSNDPEQALLLRELERYRD